MRLLLIDHVSTAVHSLRSTKIRTLLTTLGVAIGVASVTTILSLSSGITHVISAQVHGLGGNIAVVRPGAPSKDFANLTNPVIQQSFNTSTLSEDDLTAIAQLPDVTDAAPIMIISGTLSAGKTTANNSTLLATTPAFANVSGITIDSGQFIDTVTNPNTAVIGPQLAINLFGTDQPIGQQFTVRGQKFTVIGVLKQNDDPVNFNNVDFNNAAIISLEAGKGFHQGIAQIQQINVRAKNVKALPHVIKEMNNILYQNHQKEHDYSIISGNNIATPTSQLFVAITGIMTAIAAISLIVGGIGIMNIMLVGVAERTREIGLRKAVGASNGNIIWQFMIESLIICLLGAVIGYVGGYIIAFGISTFLTFNPAITWQIAVISLGISLVVGVVFGLYPAVRAARKDPIESLRQYH